MSNSRSCSIYLNKPGFNADNAPKDRHQIEFRRRRRLLEVSADGNDEPREILWGIIPF
jgi:hypothetical protein